MTSTRKRAKVVSYVYDDSDPESDYTPKIKRPAKRRKESDSEYGHANRPITGRATPHPVSRHIIKNTDDIRRSLLDWYSRVHENRGMPWRKPFDSSLDAKGRSQRAYEVWISEIMLQQTQVATVIPYYNRWMEKFPTINDLANSDIETVNSLWKGLGYYSRAARLLSGAQKIVKEYGGLFPETAKDMITNVPGIGRYSAGAISSIAYNHCEPVLDGNVNRLLSRVLALHANPKNKSTLDVLWDGAAAMVKGAVEPGNINQALIELGATICKPRDPACKNCPIKDFCGAHRESQGKLGEEQDIEELCTLCEPVHPDEDAGVMRYPMKVERKKAREEVDVVNVIEWLSPSGTRHFLLVRRPEKGLLAGLHEFPSRADVQDVLVEDSTNGTEPLQKIGQEVLRDLLASPPPPYNASTSSKLKASASAFDTAVEGEAKEKEKEASERRLQITKMKSIGDVLHVFSHIRKTYRVQWVLLEGSSSGGSAPSLDLRADPDPESPPALKEEVDHGHAVTAIPPVEMQKAAGKRRRDRNTGAGADTSEKSTKGVASCTTTITNTTTTTTTTTAASKPKAPNLRWVEYKDVEHANIGTGMMKVWKKANELWARNSAAASFFFSSSSSFAAAA